MDRSCRCKRGGELDDPDFGREPGGSQRCRRAKSQRDAVEPVDDPGRAPTSRPTTTIFMPPFVGSRVAKGISLDDIAGYINETALFRNQWQFRPESGRERRRRSRRASGPTLREQLGERQGRGLLVPAVVVRLLRRQQRRQRPRRSGRTTPAPQEWLRFDFPRQRKAPFLCIADFFRPIESGEPDYAAFHVVTMGTAVSRARAGAVRGRPVPGLPVAARPRRSRWPRRSPSLAPPHPRGVGLRRRGRPDARRPVPPAVPRRRATRGATPRAPTSRTRRKVAELLEIDRIGVALSEEFHLVRPSRRRRAIICHHPEAKYFVV